MKKTAKKRSVYIIFLLIIVLGVGGVGGYFLYNNVLSYKNISTAAEFKAIQNDLSGKYRLKNDIDFGGETIEPFGTFTGKFDGNGKTVRNFKIDSLTQNVGLFSQLGDGSNYGKIENLKADGKVAGLGNVGGIIGYLLNGEITNCEMRGSVGSQERPDANNVGGIIGYAANYYAQGPSVKDVKFTNLTNYASVNGKENIGGIVGGVNIESKYEKENNTITHSNFINHGDINGTNYVGGLVGAYNGKGGGYRHGGANTGINRDYEATTNLENCKNFGKVVAIGNDAGGLIGLCNNIGSSTGHYRRYHLSNLENSGTVNGNDNVGGIIGRQNRAFESFDNISNSGNINGNNFVGGFLGYGYTVALKGLTNTVNVTGNSYVGGIAGVGTRIENCANKGTITATGFTLEDGVRYINLGGLVGATRYLLRSTNEGVVAFANDDISGAIFNVGGLAGKVSDANRSTSVKACENKGVVLAAANNVGGIAGYINLGTMAETGDNYRTSDAPQGHIADSKNSGVVYGAFYVGGIAGQIDAPVATFNASTLNNLINSFSSIGSEHVSIIYNCVNSGYVSGLSVIGGIIGTANASNNLVAHNEYWAEVYNTVTSTAAQIYQNAADQLVVLGEKVESALSLNGFAGATEQTVSLMTHAANLVTGLATSGVIEIIKFATFLDNTHIVAFYSCENTGNVEGAGFVAGICGKAGSYVSMPFYSQNNGTVTSLNATTRWDIMQPNG